MAMNAFNNFKVARGFSLFEIVICISILFLALTPLFTTIFSQKDFANITIKEIQATCYIDEIISQLYVYPVKFLKHGSYSSAALTKSGIPTNEIYSINIFGASSPDLYLTSMEPGYERSIEITGDPVLKLFKISVKVTYDTVSVTGKPSRGAVNGNAIISAFEQF